MSEIRATTISDSAGTGPITLTGQMGVKAYAHTSGSSSLYESFNISSTVDSGTTGRTDHNLTNSMSSVRYSVMGTTNTSNDGHVSINASSSSKYITYSFDGTTRTDYTTMSTLVGDLA